MRQTPLTVALGLLAALMLAPTAPAQAGCTAPDGYLTKCAEHHSYLRPTNFLRGSRVQYGDATFKKGNALSLTCLQWRPAANHVYGSTSGMGRKFSTFLLQLGHCDVSKMTSVFARNYLKNKAATLVYTTSLSLPTLTGTQKCTWGKAGNLPFVVKFFYNGKDDLLQDFFTTGGTLLNGYKGSPFSSSYFLDATRGVGNGWSSLDLFPGVGGKNQYVPRAPGSGKGRCSDSGSTSGDAYTYAAMTIYNDNFSITSLRGRFVPRLQTHQTRKNSAVLASVTISGSDVGVALGAVCNRLHLHMPARLLISARTANGSTGSATHINGPPLTYAPILVGAPIYAQAAWNDSGSGGGLGLTIAARLVLPKKGGAFGCPPERVVYRFRIPVGSSERWFPDNNFAGHGFIEWAHNKIDRYCCQ